MKRRFLYKSWTWRPLQAHRKPLWQLNVFFSQRKYFCVFWKIARFQKWWAWLELAPPTLKWVSSCKLEEDVKGRVFCTKDVFLQKTWAWRPLRAHRTPLWQVNVFFSQTKHFCVVWKTARFQKWWAYLEITSPMFEMSLFLQARCGRKKTFFAQKLKVKTFPSAQDTFKTK